MRNKTITRRAALRQSTAATAALWALPRQTQADDPGSSTKSSNGCTLGFSTYGMKSLKVEQAIATVAEIGYDAIEIAVRADWDSAPARMSPQRRLKVRRLLSETNLRLTSLMEHLIPESGDKPRTAELDRLAGVFELADDLSRNKKPLVQTVLGGGQWDKKREFFRDRLGDWLELAEKHEVVIAIKPHRGGGMSRPSEAVWLIEQLGHPRWLRMVYDYSHYAFRDMPLEKTIDTALPYTAHIAVKDPAQQGGRVVFKLPGEAATIDYAKLIRQFYDGGYRGDFNCEVSGMVSGKPGYDPSAAARRCYKAIAAAFESSGVPRA